MDELKLELEKVRVLVVARICEIVGTGPDALYRIRAVARTAETRVGWADAELKLLLYLEAAVAGLLEG